MSVSVARALKMAGALAAGSVLIWFAMDWWVKLSDDILVVEKGSFAEKGSASPRPMVLRFVDSAAGQRFMVGISTFGSEDRNELWEKLKPGCRYSIRYIDQSRYPVPSGKSGMSGTVIFSASPLDCPGLLVEAETKAPSAEELLDGLIRPRKAPQP